MKNIVSHHYYNRISKRYINEHWVKEHGITKEQIDFNKSFVLQQQTNQNEFSKIPYLDFFDCDCPDKKDHTLTLCEIFRRRQYKKLINGKFNMNKRGSLIMYKQMMRRYKPNYIVTFYVKKL